MISYKPFHSFVCVCVGGGCIRREELDLNVCGGWCIRREELDLNVSLKSQNAFIGLIFMNTIHVFSFKIFI